jgi:periplasmic protein TonB
MREPSFDLITQRLLHAGIAPKYAKRLHQELQDHYRDLERDESRRAVSPEGAAAEARRRLGADDAIVGEFLRRPELRSWIYRSKLAFHCLRAVSSIYLGFHLVLERVCSAIASVVPLAGRLAAAGAAAAILMAGALHLMQATIGGGIVLPPGDTLAAAAGAANDLRTADQRRQLVAETRARPEEPRGTRERGAVQRLQRPRLAPAPPRPAYPDHAELAVPSSSPTLQIAAVAPDTGVAPPQFRVADGDLLPIVRVAPMFPPRAAARGIEGYVVVEYTVTRAGSVTDIVVVESSNSIFERPALEAAGKFRYRPRVVDGQPVAVQGVRTMMSFVLEV